jgi:Spy/CpxP family protein refolding chaperone
VDLKQTQPKQKFMKSNKMTLIAALAVGSLLVLSPATRAQDSTNTPAPSTPAVGGGAGAGGGGMRGRGPSLDQLAKTLNLTDDQKTQVKPILDAQQQKMRDLMQDTTLSREDKMAKRKTIHDDTGAQLKPILTADQYAQWEKMGTRQRRPAPAAADTNAPAATPPAAAPQT